MTTVKKLMLNVLAAAVNFQPHNSELISPKHETFNSPTQDLKKFLHSSRNAPSWKKSNCHSASWIFLTVEITWVTIKFICCDFFPKYCNLSLLPLKETPALNFLYLLLQLCYFFLFKQVLRWPRHKTASSTRYCFHLRTSW